MRFILRDVGMQSYFHSDFHFGMDCSWKQNMRLVFACFACVKHARQDRRGWNSPQRNSFRLTLPVSRGSSGAIYGHYLRLSLPCLHVVCVLIVSAFVFFFLLPVGTRSLCEELWTSVSFAHFQEGIHGSACGFIITEGELSYGIWLIKHRLMYTQ